MSRVRGLPPARPAAASSDQQRQPLLPPEEAVAPSSSEPPQSPGRPAPLFLVFFTEGLSLYSSSQKACPFIRAPFGAAVRPVRGSRRAGVLDFVEQECDRGVKSGAPPPRRRHDVAKLLECGRPLGLCRFGFGARMEERDWSLDVLRPRRSRTNGAQHTSAPLVRQRPSHD